MHKSTSREYSTPEQVREFAEVMQSYNRELYDDLNQLSRFSHVTTSEWIASAQPIFAPMFYACSGLAMLKGDLAFLAHLLPHDNPRPPIQNGLKNLGKRHPEDIHAVVLEPMLFGTIRYHLQQHGITHIHAFTKEDMESVRDKSKGTEWYPKHLLVLPQERRVRLYASKGTIDIKV